jgi:hypothetical protein
MSILRGTKTSKTDRTLGPGGYTPKRHRQKFLFLSFVISALFATFNNPLSQRLKILTRPKIAIH